MMNRHFFLFVVGHWSSGTIRLETERRWPADTSRDIIAFFNYFHLYEQGQTIADYHLPWGVRYKRLGQSGGSAQRDAGCHRA